MRLLAVTAFLVGAMLCGMFKAAAAVDPPVAGTAPAAKGSDSEPAGAAAATVPPAIATPPPPPPNFGPAAQELGNYVPTGWTAGELIQQALPTGSSGAEQALLYLREYRATGVASRDYQRGQRRVLARIYKFESAQGAYGAYTCLRRGATTVVTRGDASSEDDQSLSIWQDDCYLHISTTAEDDDEAKEMMRSLATHLTGAIGKRADLPEIIADLPQLDRVGGSEKLIMGPLVARRMLAIPDLAALDLDRSRVAACADYQFQFPRPERMRLLLIDYGDPVLALASYRRYCDTIEANHDLLESGRTTLFKLRGSFLHCLVRGKFVAVISGARGRHSPMYLAKQLDKIPTAAQQRP